MKHLFLLRHGDTEHHSDTGQDHDRALTALGHSNAEHLAQWMKNGEYTPDFIYCSSARRTTETCQTVMQNIYDAQKPPVLHDRLFYNSSAQTLMQEIKSANKDVHALMVVVHNPGVTELALTLAGSQHTDKIYGYAPGTMTVFKCDIDQWSDLDPSLTELADIFTP